MEPKQQHHVEPGQQPHLQHLPPSMWAISYRQLMDIDATAKKIFGRWNYALKTMRHIHESLIVPHCQKCGTSYALSLNPEGLPIEAFITHGWDEPFSDFVSSIRHAFHPFPKKPNLWICAFALPQGQSNVIESLLTEAPLEESPFVKALSQATWFVVVRNYQKDIYSRIWCVCELMYAKKFGFTTTNRTMVVGPDRFAHLATSCLEAEASNPRDKIKILEALQGQADDIDELVQQYRMHGNPPATFNPHQLRRMFLPFLLATTTTLPTLFASACCFLLVTFTSLTVLALAVFGNYESTCMTTRALTGSTIVGKGNLRDGLVQPINIDHKREGWMLVTSGPGKYDLNLYSGHDNILVGRATVEVAKCASREDRQSNTSAVLWDMRGRYGGCSFQRDQRASAVLAHIAPWEPKTVNDYVATCCNVGEECYVSFFGRISGVVCDYCFLKEETSRIMQWIQEAGSQFFWWGLKEELEPTRCDHSLTVPTPPLGRELLLPGPSQELEPICCDQSSSDSLH